MTQFPTFSLSLADGTKLTLVSADERAARLLEIFAAATQLEARDQAELLLTVSTNDEYMLIETMEGGVFQVSLSQNRMENPICFFGLSQIIAQQTSSGVLLHGALAEYKNRGVILIAQGGTGKTTASNRLSFPWRSLSDDLTLVIRDRQGKYWAHPFPTWSCFSDGDERGQWNIQKRVPMAAIFHLSQSETDRVESMSTAEAMILLLQSAEQALFLSKHIFDVESLRVVRLRLFDQFSILTRTTPIAKLYLSLSGSFWNGMEKLLDIR